MKRKYITLLCIIATFSLLFVACNKQKENNEDNTSEKAKSAEETDDLDIADAILMNEEDAPSAANNDGFYKRSPKWDQIKNPVLAVQVGNDFYEVGMTVEEVVNIMENSEFECKVISETNDTFDFNELVDPYDFDERYPDSRLIKFNVGYDILGITVINPTDEAIPIKDCYVVEYILSTLLVEESHYLGYNPEELRTWTKEDCCALVEDGALLDTKKYGYIVSDETSGWVELETQEPIIIELGEYKIQALSHITFWFYGETMDRVAFDEINDIVVIKD